MTPLHASPLRVCFITVMPSPYTVDMFTAITADGRIRPQVFYLEQAAPDTHWQASSLPSYAEVLPGTSFRFLGGRLHVNPGALARLKQVEADLFILAGYAGVTNQAVMRWLHRSGKPWIFWGETPGMRRGNLLGMFRSLAQRPAVRWPQGIAAIGSRAAEAYQRLTTEQCVVRNIPYHCDLKPFFALRQDQPKSNKQQAAERVRFLYCGQLIERKGVDHLLPAFCRVAQQYPGVTLSLVGTGPLQASLEQGVPAELKSRVEFVGFRQIADLPAEFGKADVFVLPSRHDGWGVVVNQAIAAGLPVICSEGAGAGVDLVLPGENGIHFPAGNEAALQQALEFYATQPALCQEQGARSRQIAQQWTPECGVERWVGLCSEVLERVGRLPRATQTRTPEQVS